MIHTDPDQTITDLSLFQDEHRSKYFVRDPVFVGFAGIINASSPKGGPDSGRPHPLSPATAGNKHHRLVLNLGCLPVPLFINLLRGVANIQ